MYSELLSIDKPAHLHVEIQDPPQVTSSFDCTDLINGVCLSKLVMILKSLHLSLGHCNVDAKSKPGQSNQLDSHR